MMTCAIFNSANDTAFSSYLNCLDLYVYTSIILTFFLDLLSLPTRVAT